MRLVTLDSNIYVSALHFGGGPLRILQLGRAGLIRIDISAEILVEVVGVLRDRFGWEGMRLYWTRLELLRFTNLVVPRQQLAVITDPDDNRILECAVEAGSEFIITNDKALLRVGEYGNIRIVTIAEFLQSGR